MSGFQSLGLVTGLYRVTLVGADPVEIDVKVFDILRWEQVHNKSFYEGAIGMSRLAWAAWAAMTRAKLTELKPDQFLAQLEDLERFEEPEPEEESGEAEEDLGVPLPSPTRAAGTV